MVPTASHSQNDQEYVYFRRCVHTLPYQVPFVASSSLRRYSEVPCSGSTETKPVYVTASNGRG